MQATAFLGARLGSSTALRGQQLQQRPGVSLVARPAQLTIEAAHKKGAGSTKNGRDSNSKRRGVKVYGGQPVSAGGIIIRQLGTKVWKRCRRMLGMCGGGQHPAAAASRACQCRILYERIYVQSPWERRASRAPTHRAAARLRRHHRLTTHKLAPPARSFSLDRFSFPLAQVHPGQNVGLGKDYTLYSLIEGVVVFERRAQKQRVNVIPFEVRVGHMWDWSCMRALAGVCSSFRKAIAVLCARLCGGCAGQGHGRGCLPLVGDD